MREDNCIITVLLHWDCMALGSIGLLERLKHQAIEEACYNNAHTVVL